MILEIADIRIHTGQNAAFDEAIARGLRTVVSGAHGFRTASVHHCMEHAGGPHRGLSAVRSVYAMARHRRAVFRRTTAGGTLSSAA